MAFDHIVFNRPNMSAEYFSHDGTTMSFDASGDAWGNFGGTDDGTPPAPPYGHACWMQPGHYELGDADDNGADCASEGEFQIHVNDLSDGVKLALEQSGHLTADPATGMIDIGGATGVRGGLARFGRLGVMIHGGGGNLGLPAALAPRQPLLRTFGCTRVHNDDLAALVQRVRASRAAGVPIVFSCLGDPADVGR